MKRTRKGSWIRSSNITVIFSIALVLFLLGVIGLFMINSERYKDTLLEQLKVNIFLEDAQFKNKPEKLKEAHDSFLSNLNLKDYAKRTRYISKEDALKEFQQENQNLDIEELFDGEQILPASVELSLHSEYYIPAKVDSIKQLLEKNTLVTEATIDGDIIVNAYNNIRKITIGIIAFFLLFLSISVVLINNYIRLRIFSKRFLIKTMQLVGARRFFIVKPFLGEAFWLGFLSAILAIIPIVLLQFAYTYYAQGNEEITNLIKDKSLIIVVGAVFLIGVFITFSSTWAATRRYLKLSNDQLYNY